MLLKFLLILNNKSLDLILLQEIFKLIMVNAKLYLNYYISTYNAFSPPRKTTKLCLSKSLSVKTLSPL